MSENHLLSSLSSSDRTLLQPHLEPTSLRLRQVLEEPNRPIKWAYFPHRGLSSVIASATRDRKIEVGLIGRDGMTGVSIVLGNDRSANEIFVQIAGIASRIRTENLRDAMQTSGSLRLCLLHFAQAFLMQTSYTALANGRASIEERLARWLLMAHDRLDGDEIPLTHEFLSLMLAVRRAGVTTALHLLESQDLIAAKRGVIVIVNRDGLEEFADGLYGTPEAEQLRLTGWRGRN